jgi:hypothetical protein
MGFLWGMKRLLLLTLGGGLGLAACQPAAPATKAPAATPPPPVSCPLPAAPPRYEGTYAGTDSADCPLAITITRRDTSYFFAHDTVRGPVRVWRDAAGTETGFTFVGLKSVDPEDEDIGCVWQDSMLLLQNYGNAMNEYQRFACGAKYLELRRQ